MNLAHTHTQNDIDEAQPVGVFFLDSPPPSPDLLPLEQSPSWGAVLAKGLLHALPETFLQWSLLVSRLAAGYLTVYQAEAGG